jgi:hypothetical protein
MALARSRRLGIADLLELNKRNGKKDRHFPSATALGAMTDSHLRVFFLRIGWRNGLPLRLWVIAAAYNHRLSTNIKTF